MDDSDKLHDARDAMEGDGALDGPEILRAVAAGCYLMAIADGSVSPDERRRIAKTLVVQG